MSQNIKKFLEKNKAPIINNKFNNPGISENEITNFENNLNITLPKDFKKFLLKYNGGQPIPEIFLTPNSEEYSDINIENFNTLEVIIEEYNYLKNERLNNVTSTINFLPIANNGHFDYIGLNLNKDEFGYVYFLQDDTENFYFIDYSLTSLLQNYSTDENSAFEALAYCKDNNSIKYLVENNEIKLNNLEEALELAIKYENIELFNYFIDKGVKPTNIVLYAPIYINDTLGVDILEKLLTFKDLDLNQCGFDDVNMLMVAIKNKKFKIANSLINHGINTSKKDKNEKNALNYLDELNSMEKINNEEKALYKELKIKLNEKINNDPTTSG
jgi:cell wall assembly regulator SMI1